MPMGLWSPFFTAKETAQGNNIKKQQKSPLRAAPIKGNKREVNFGRCPESFVERGQVAGRRMYSQRKAVPEFTSGRNKRLKMLVNSCLRDLDSIGVSKSRKWSAAGPREGRKACRYKFKVAVSVKISVDGRKRCNIVTEFKR